MEIKHKIAIVTGASHGVGYEVAKILAREGATVILADDSKESLTKIEQEIPGSLSIPTDAHDHQSVKALVDAVIEKYWHIDIFVNAADEDEECAVGPIGNINIEKYRKAVGQRASTALSAMQIVIPFMQTRSGGTIINIAPPASRYFLNLGMHASAGQALTGLSLAARAEFAKDDVVISVIHPGLNKGRIDQPIKVAQKIAALIRSEAPESDA